ncbi:MAG: family 43 glycosylhydrolase [Opitutales bacterium]
MKVRIDNLRPRRDTEGHILDAHGGALFNRFDGVYYNYGVRYGETDGYSPAIDFACYTSKDLQTWRHRGSIWDGTQRTGMHFRPHVVRHPASGRFILWFLFYERFQRPGPEKTGPNICIKGTATAESPAGPFTPHQYGVPLSCALSGDHDLFVDEDGTAYLAHSHHDFSGEKGRATIRVERLNPDYLSSSGEHVVLESEGIPCEAPALFKRNDTYYCLFDQWTDRLKWGSGARVYTAAHPLGPWTYRGNPNRNDQGEFIVWAQQNTVARIESETGPVYLWAGDRWRTTEHLGTDLQYWHPLSFSDDGMIQPFAFQDSWTIDLPV